MMKRNRYHWKKKYLVKNSEIIFLLPANLLFTVNTLTSSMKNNLPGSQSVVAWTVGWHHHGEGMADLRISNWFQSNLSIPTSITESLPLSEGLPTHVTVPEKIDMMIFSNSSSLQKSPFFLNGKNKIFQTLFTLKVLLTLFYQKLWQCSGRT